jgi:hypothetical protein
MSKATDAFDVLQKAMETALPACIEDGRFTDDYTRAEDVRDICNQCPLLDSCLDYGRTARPRGGIWAGKRWGRS